MGRVLDNTKLLVRKAKQSELEWLAKNRASFEIGYNIPNGILRKEWPCFVLLKGKEIIGYRSFEFHEVGGKRFAWVGSTSLKKGYEGKGLGPFLVGRANSALHALKFNEFSTWAYNPRAKKFWVREGFVPRGGAKLTEVGNTRFSFNLKKQREVAEEKTRVRNQARTRVKNQARKLKLK
ncbi:MAG: GNAT family N-acetyltransferase [Candidatus Iainarchaeum sp.]|jgi:GNAT superfamily N-acetyltransferase|nr:MAG: hypothetical protein BWY55_00874 [archaeon ADurb.Bin336]